MKAPTAVLEELVAEAERAKAERDKAEARFKLLKKRIANEMDELETNEFLIDDGRDELLQARRQTQTRVTYAAGILRQSIPRVMFKRIAKTVIDPAKVEALVETGQLSFEQVQPAADVTEWDAMYIRRIERK